MTRKSKFALASEKLGSLSFGERLLLAFSDHPDDVDKTSRYAAPTRQWSVETALAQLEEAFPGFAEKAKGKRVLDYGCGDGFQSVALAKAGAQQVLGVEIEANRRAHGEALASKEGVRNVAFAERVSGKFDIVISLNAMEHFISPEENLREMRQALAPGGRIYVSFGPLWMAPYGHHMHFFTRAPWINLLFSEKTVFHIRRLYRDDGAASWSPGMNRMTVAMFERLIAGCGLRAVHRRDRTAANLPLVGKVPLVREFFVNLIDAELAPTDEGTAETAPTNCYKTSKNRNN
ncbi:class I SAM-dependent methyltransferase [Hyphococcus sp.]|jgi:SAM-dependent methyltransferase|uniref:class I SAM-dependent methyltransferase n=1 Tax=Hyphococcus sp. TaxID=2038636 RepID=UPI003D0FCF84